MVRSIGVVSTTVVMIAMNVTVTCTGRLVMNTAHMDFKLWNN